MRLTFILCFTSVFLCVECGLIKNFLGAVSDEVHKITDGNIVKNVVNIVHNETKGIVEDLGDLLHIRKPSDQNKGPIEPNEDNKYEDVPNTVTTPVITQASTTQIKIDENMQPNVSNNQDINVHPAKETIKVNEITDNENRAVESSKISTESTDSGKLVFIEEDYHYGEGTISPRIARHIKVDNQTKGAMTQQEMQNTNEDETNFSVGNESVAENSQQSITFNFNNFNDLLPINNITLPSDNKDIEIIVIGVCPDGQELSLDGLCVEATTEIQEPKKGKNRANFVGGCFYGFAKADDGTCQEVIYD